MKVLAQDRALARPLAEPVWSVANKRLRNGFGHSDPHAPSFADPRATRPDSMLATSMGNPVNTQPQIRKYVPAVSPRLRILFYVILGLVALIGVNSVYMASITALEFYSQRWGDGVSYQNHFYLSMFAVHLAFGLLLIAPFLVFGIVHMLASRNRRNRRAVRIGYALFGICLVLLLTGLALVRLEGVVELKNPAARSAVYWAHVLSPLAAGWLYWLHRLAGPRIKWHIGRRFAAVTAVIVVALVVWHAQDPRHWYAKGPEEGPDYFKPSLVKTTNGNLISAETLMMDDYCLKCHPDAYEGWFHSVHHFSSFNNPTYRASVRETRQVLLKREGNVKASRWCAGCHDPVPFLSGAFDNKDFDDINDPTAHAGITCTTCHAITHVNSPRGNADFTIEEPLHYPFAYSKNPLLQYVNHQLVKAKPAFHKQTFLKPFHKTAEFCSTCHKVHLPKELTDYKEFLRGQNHYDSYLLSGVSGHGARSFYYPPKAQTNCNGCHMPLQASDDFGAKPDGKGGSLTIHNHLFPSANTGVAYLRDEESIIAEHQKFLDGVMRIDIFGVKENGQIDGELHAPLRPVVPSLQPGKSYLLEIVIRTMKMGHHFTQGTVDSNEIWVDLTATSGSRVIGRSGALDEKGEVDPWSHFVNVFMLDREGRRIDRRNAQDIFVPLYNHQIPPGAGQVVHFRLDVPADATEEISLDVKLQFRKFDQRYMQFVADSALPGDEPLRDAEPGQPYRNRLPITTLATDSIRFPLAGQPLAVKNDDRDIPAWQRWNDYGIGLLLEGQGGATGELRQAAEAFSEVQRLGQYHGPLNLARVYFAEGRLDDAVAALQAAATYDDPPAPHWTLSWLTGVVNKQQGYLDKAIKNLRSVVEDRSPEMIERGFDFSYDYMVINELGQTLFERAKQFRGAQRQQEREAMLRQAVEQFERTLTIDPENVTAHYNLALLFTQLGQDEDAAVHRQLHARYKPDDNARDRAIALARNRYPAANHAAEPLVIYSLSRSLQQEPSNALETPSNDDSE